MIIAFAGLPATGKSTIAGQLNSRLHAVILDKDRIRSSLFLPEDIEYSRKQDDFCMGVAYQVAEYLLEKEPERSVIIDGRTFCARDQLETLTSLARRLGQPLKIIECVCSDENARKRLEQDARSARHPAADRDFSLYLRLKSMANPIPPPKLVLDTDQAIEICVNLCMDYVQADPA